MNSQTSSFEVVSKLEPSTTSSPHEGTPILITSHKLFGQTSTSPQVASNQHNSLLAHQGTLSAAFTTKKRKSKPWIVYSRALDLMTTNKRYFFAIYAQPQQFNSSNSRWFPIKSSTDWSCETHKGSHFFLYSLCPKFDCNLFSIS